MTRPIDRCADPPQGMIERMFIWGCYAVGCGVVSLPVVAVGTIVYYLLA